jgi:hypothetical protein
MSQIPGQPAASPLPDGDLPAELLRLIHALRATATQVEQLTADLDESSGTWRPAPDAWSVAECLDHLATANRVYIDAMEIAARPAAGSRRHGPAVPGLFGRWFVRTLEPPVKKIFVLRAPRLIRPRVSPPLADARSAFFDAETDVDRFIHQYAFIDLARTHFPNPFITGVRFSLATGLHVIAAHNRRHVWQARNVVAAMKNRRP